MSTRLTHTDLLIINEALAYYEAEVEADTNQPSPRFSLPAIERTRAKIHQRLT